MYPEISVFTVQMLRSNEGVTENPQQRSLFASFQQTGGNQHSSQLHTQGVIT